MPTEDQPMYSTQTSQGLYINEELSIPSSSQVRFLMKEPNTDYKVLLEGSAPENIAAGEFTINFYSSNNPGGPVKKVETEEGEEEGEDEGP